MESRRRPPGRQRSRRQSVSRSLTKVSCGPRVSAGADATPCHQRTKYIMSREQEDRTLGAADFFGHSEASPNDRDLDREERERERRQAQDDAARQLGYLYHDGIRDGAVEQLAALFDEDAARDFRTRWNEVQIGFADDPRRSVQRADELVAQVMSSLAESFSRQRTTIESDAEGTAPGNTENLRLALRSYRSFFERLLAL